MRGFSRLTNFMPFCQNSPANQHDQHVPAHVQPTASTPTSTIQQVSSVATNLCKEGDTDHLTMENHHHVNSCDRLFIVVTSAGLSSDANRPDI